MLCQYYYMNNITEIQYMHIVKYKVLCTSWIELLCCKVGHFIKTNLWSNKRLFKNKTKNHLKLVCEYCIASQISPMAVILGIGHGWTWFYQKGEWAHMQAFVIFLHQNVLYSFSVNKNRIQWIIFQTSTCTYN